MSPVSSQRSTTTRGVGIALLLAALGAGCGAVTSLRPLYLQSDLGQPVVDPRVEGEWISPDLDKPGVDRVPWLSWKITRQQANSDYEIEMRGSDPHPDSVSVFDGRFVSIGGTLFFDARFQADMEGETVVRNPSSSFLVPGHVVGRIWVQQDFMRIALLIPDWVKEHLPPSSWIDYAEKYEDSVLITHSTEDLRRVLVQHADDREAFGYPIYLCRAGTDCKPRAVEEELERWGPEDDAVEFAAKVFSARGNHPREIALRKQRTQVKPYDVWRHLDLGRAYLLNRDFADARQAFAAADRLELAQPPGPGDGSGRTASTRAAEDTAWSYFLEGRYADVLGTVNAYTPPGANASANPILLDYFSRIRLGRRAEAESVLQASTSSFIGRPSEHLLLLAAGQRLVNAFQSSDQSSDRMAFFGGLQEIVAGHIDRARLMLRQAANSTDGVIALAGRVELERLGSPAGR